MLLETIQLDNVERLCQQGLFLQAYNLSGDGEVQSDGHAISYQLLLNRILSQLGAERTSIARSIRLWRTHRQEVETTLCFVHSLLSLQRPLKAWKLLKEFPLPSSPIFFDAAFVEWELKTDGNPHPT